MKCSCCGEPVFLIVYSDGRVKPQIGYEEDADDPSVCTIDAVIGVISPDGHWTPTPIPFGDVKGRDIAEMLVAQGLPNQALFPGVWKLVRREGVEIPTP